MLLYNECCNYITVPHGSLLASTSDSIKEKRLYCFELQYDDGNERIKIAADTAGEVQSWMVDIADCTEEATILVSVLSVSG